MISQSLQGFSQFFNVIWLLLFLAPAYLMMAKFLQHFFNLMMVFLAKRNTFLYKRFGNLTWLLPFKSKKDLQWDTKSYLLVAILLSMLSLFIVMSIIAYNTTQMVQIEQQKFERMVYDQQANGRDKKNKE